MNSSRKRVYREGQGLKWEEQKCLEGVRSAALGPLLRGNAKNIIQSISYILLPKIKQWSLLKQSGISWSLCMSIL